MNAKKEYRKAQDDLIEKQLKYDYLPEEEKKGKTGKDMKHEMFVLEGLIKIYKKLIVKQDDERG